MHHIYFYLQQSSNTGSRFSVISASVVLPLCLSGVAADVLTDHRLLWHRQQQSCQQQWADSSSPRAAQKTSWAPWRRVATHTMCTSGLDTQLTSQATPWAMAMVVWCRQLMVQCQAIISQAPLLGRHSSCISSTTCSKRMQPIIIISSNKP